jgi:hypothetical protein
VVPETRLSILDLRGELIPAALDGLPKVKVGKCGRGGELLRRHRRSAARAEASDNGERSPRKLLRAVVARLVERNG